MKGEHLKRLLQFTSSWWVPSCRIKVAALRQWTAMQVAACGKTMKRLFFFSLQKLMFQPLAPPYDEDRMLQTSAFKYITVANLHHWEFKLCLLLSTDAARMQSFTKYLPLDSGSGQFLIDFVWISRWFPVTTICWEGGVCLQTVFCERWWPCL